MGEGEGGRAHASHRTLQRSTATKGQPLVTFESGGQSGEVEVEVLAEQQI